MPAQAAAQQAIVELEAARREGQDIEARLQHEQVSHSRALLQSDCTPAQALEVLGDLPPTFWVWEC